jgi:hypothetical protein
MSTLQSLLEQMGQIQEMERGKLCPMRDGRYFNHQTWEQGRNVVRYVPAAQVPALRRSIAGYQRFLKLAEQYVALIVQQTRQRRLPARPKTPSSTPGRLRTPPQPQKGQKEEE